MSKLNKMPEARGLIVSFLVVANLVFVLLGIIAGNAWLWGLLFFLPLLTTAVFNITQRRHSLL